jgi:hypothetical protein
MYFFCGCALLWSVHPLPLFSVTPLSPTPPFLKSFHYIFLFPLPSHAMVCNITDGLSFFFLFPLSLSSIHLYHWFQCAVHLSEFMIIIVFVYKFLFRFIFLWDKRWSSMQKPTFIPKTNIFCVHHWMVKSEQVPHTHQCQWSCIHMIAVHTVSAAGQHCIMCGPGNCWPRALISAHLQLLSGYPDGPHCISHKERTDWLFMIPIIYTSLQEAISFCNIYLAR